MNNGANILRCLTTIYTHCFTFIEVTKRSQSKLNDNLLASVGKMQSGKATVFCNVLI